MKALFPRCDSRVLHTPGECDVCDLFPKQQRLRIRNKIDFTGKSTPGFRRCPAEARRMLETINAWPGNAPK